MIARSSIINEGNKPRKLWYKHYIAYDTYPPGTWAFTARQLSALFGTVAVLDRQNKQQQITMCWLRRGNRVKVYYRYSTASVSCEQISRSTSSRSVNDSHHTINGAGAHVTMPLPLTWRREGASMSFLARLSWVTIDKPISCCFALFPMWSRKNSKCMKRDNFWGWRKCIHVKVRERIAEENIIISGARS